MRKSSASSWCCLKPSSSSLSKKQRSAKQLNARGLSVNIIFIRPHFVNFLPEVEEKLKISLNNVFNLDLADLFFSFITAVQIFWILYSLGFIEPPKSSVKVLNTLCSVSCTWIFRIIYKIRTIRTTIDIMINIDMVWMVDSKEMIY